LKRALSVLIMVVATLSGAAPAKAAQPGRAVAITIDDLPRGGDGGARTYAALAPMTRKLLEPFREQHVPVTGFVNAARYADYPEGLEAILRQWLDAGAELGNHSYSHPDLNSVPLDAYTADVLKGEKPLRAMLESRGKKLTYFRHPYLHVGATPAAKAGLANFLAGHGYVVAPVTFDTADYLFAQAYLKPELHERARREYLPYLTSVVAFFESRAVEVVGHEFPQILLIHANELNADVMPQLLEMFRRRGYRFVSLEEALRDPAYQLPEDYIGRGGFSWIHRWSRAKGMPAKGEPDAPEWVTKAFSPMP